MKKSGKVKSFFVKTYLILMILTLLNFSFVNIQTTIGNINSNVYAEPDIQGKIEKSIFLQIDNPLMYVNGIQMEVDPGRGSKPVIINSRTLLPIRAIIEAIGGNIEWDEQQKKVTINVAQDTILLWIGMKEMLVNNRFEINDVAPVIINDRTYIPLRFVAENVGCEVVWDGIAKSVTITYVYYPQITSTPAISMTPTATQTPVTTIPPTTPSMPTPVTTVTPTTTSTPVQTPVATTTPTFQSSPTPTPTTTPTPEPPDSLLIEAEEMTLSGYTIDDNEFSSGAKLVRTESTGTAEYIIPDYVSGQYDICTTYFDENDGNSEFSFLLNDNEIDSWIADRNYYSGVPIKENKVVHRIREINISGGEKITIIGNFETSEYARIDCIELILSSMYEPPSNDTIGERIVLIAMAENGRGPEEVGKDLEEYPYDLARHIPEGSAWCSEFLAWAAKAAGCPYTGGYIDGWMITGNTWMREWYQENGKFIDRDHPEWDTFTPSAGDFVRYHTDGGGHTGIVRYVEGTTLYTVEGNVSNKVVLRSFENWREVEKIDGFGVRDFTQFVE